MTYVLLIYRASAEGPPPTALDERATLRGHRALQAEASARRELHAVARLDDARDARTVKRRAGAHEITDGPYVETKEWLGGVFPLPRAHQGEAVARAAGIRAPDAP